MTAPNPPVYSLMLSQLNKEHNLQEALSSIEALVRQEPGNGTHRWALIEVLCLLGQWERAIKQLQAATRLAPALQAQAQLVRGLIRAEHQRAEVFAGNLLPTPVFDRLKWMDDLARALVHNARGEHAQADTLREAALAQAPQADGICQIQSPETQPDADPDADTGPSIRHQKFTCLSDTDSRLGPVCELMISGSYRWLAFADIHSMQMQAPTHLLDLVWMPVTVQLRGTQADEQMLHGFVPSRYCGTESVSGEWTRQQRDALILARMTRWQDVGDTGVFALGQKTLMSDGVDYPLLDLREISFSA
jgi:type VI secretion system protein ImpE